MPSEEFPFELNTGRLVYQWHTRTKTARSPILHLASPEGYVEINPLDAQLLDIQMGDVVMVTTKRGSIQVPARITDAVKQGAIFIPFHYGTLTENQAANVLTLETWDLVSKQPHFKNGACRIEKIISGLGM